jgi:NTP-dependent ternary system trypsin peptidase co-occuring protein
VKVTPEGVPIGALITVIKDSIKRAGVSRTSAARDLRVASVQLTLRVVADKTVGGGLNFQVPFIGMMFSAGSKVTKQDTHTVDMTLVPPDQPANFQVRGGDVEDALVDAITTIRQTMANAAAGDDPWVLSDGTIDISFAVTRTGAISLGVNGELSSEVRHTLRIGLVPSSA